jgi:dTMP kinase
LKKRGIFITVEGIDGTGKSTQLRLLADWLRRQGYKLLLTREPGGTRVGEQIRKILLDSRNSELSSLTELLLMYAARQQHLEEVVRPALNRGEIVLSDRFNDASLAYQGYGRQLGKSPIRLLDGLVCGGTEPDLTLILDVPVRTALARASKRDGRRGQQRFESQGLRFHDRVRKGYLKIAEDQPRRVQVIRASDPVQAVRDRIREAVDRFLRENSKPKTRSQKSETRNSKLEIRETILSSHS